MPLTKRPFDEKTKGAFNLRDSRSFSLSKTLLANQILTITHTDEVLRAVDDVPLDCLSATVLWFDPLISVFRSDGDVVGESIG